MPIQPTYPGVYVQEVPSEVHTITGVSTSIALFVARSAWGPPNVPVLCLSYADFERNFTVEATVGELPHAIRLFFMNGGTRCYVMRVVGATVPAATVNNIDGVLSVAAFYGSTLGNDIHVEVSWPEPDDGLTFNMKIYLETVADGRPIQKGIEEWKGLGLTAAHPRFVNTYVKSKWVTGITTTGVRPTAGNYRLGQLPVTPGTDGSNPLLTQYAAAFAVADKDLDLFNIMVLPRSTGVAITNMVDDASTLCEKRRAFLLLDPLDGWDGMNVGAIGPTLSGGTGLRDLVVTKNSAVYFPNVMVPVEAGTIPVGPTGAIAGLMARIDSNRGVWKAPAGIEAALRGVRGIHDRLTDDENGILNPLGVNVIRSFPNGIVCWGARTLDGFDDNGSEWKYIPVRRTALFIEESLYRGLKWVVFEPNDERLWGQVRLNVGAFMHNLFSQGAFQGLKKDEAYFVRCDAETTTQNDINLGIVNIWVGFAPLKPAEFVIIHLQQMTGQIQV